MDDITLETERERKKKKEKASPDGGTREGEAISGGCNELDVEDWLARWVRDRWSE